MEVLLTVAYSALCLFIIQKWSFFAIDGFSKKALSVVFLLKVALGVLLGLIYTYYYTDRSSADIFKYFDDSEVLYQAFFTQPKHFFQMMTGIGSDADYLKPYYQTMNYWYNKYNVYNDNRTMIKLNALLRFISFGRYYVHSSIMCFISLIGLTGIMKVFNAVLMNKTKALFTIVFLLPSVLFWNSGVLKDGLLTFAFGMLLFSFFQVLKKGITLRRCCILAISIYLLLLIKLYIIVIVAPGLAAWFWAEKTALRRTGLKFFTCYLLALTALFNIERIVPGFNFKESLADKQHNFIKVSREVKTGSLIEIQHIEDNTISIVKAVPAALGNILFRPHLLEARSPFILLAAAENLLIFLVIIICLLSLKTITVKEPLFYFSVWFVFLLFALTGLVTPVMGAFVRYKVPALPFLLFVFIFLYDEKVLQRRFPVLGKFTGQLTNVLNTWIPGNNGNR